MLTTSTFFNRYIADPFSRELSLNQRSLVLTISLLLAPILLGIPHLVCYILNRKRIAVLNLSLKIHKNYEQVCNKTQQVFQTAYPSVLAVSPKSISPLANSPRPPQISRLKKKDIARAMQGIISNESNVNKNHCARAALFASVYAYLYKKYHPTYEPSHDEILLLQLAAAHNARQPSANPVSNDISEAKQLIAHLKKAGVTDPNLLGYCNDVLIGKSSPTSKYNPLIAQCVQSAGVTEDNREKLGAPDLSEKAFLEARNALGVFKDISALAQNNPQAKLKHGLTYDDFLTELDAIQLEMNRFIFTTQQKNEPASPSKMASNHYNQFLKKINHAICPLLSHILAQLGISKHPTVKWQQESAIQTAKNWLLFGVSNIPTETLEGLVFNLQKLSSNNEAQELLLKLVAEQLKRKTNANSPLPSHPSTVNLNSLLATTKDTHTDSPLKLAAQANTLLQEANELIEQYKVIPPDLRAATLLTTASLAYAKAARLYIQIGSEQLAKKALNNAAELIVFDDKHPLHDLANFDGAETYPIFMSFDCNELRKRKMRISNFKLDGADYIEFSADLPSKTREGITPFLNLLKTDPSVAVKTTKAFFPKKDFATGSFTSSEGLVAGTDLRITVGNEAEILIGHDKEFYNEFNHVRVRVKKGSSLQTVHKAFCKIGLPMAITESRPEDIQKEMLGRILAFRFPQIVYQPVSEKGVKESPELVYSKLTSEQRQIVDNDLKNMKLDKVGNGYTEWVNPALKDEAWREGARALGTFISAGTTEDTANVLAKIMQDGLLSSQERFQRGITGLGCCPEYNYKTGSANQVFTRILTKNLFDKKTSLYRFAIDGPILVMFDVQAIERMPYSYLHDRGGLRNPGFQRNFFNPQKQTPIWNYKGHERLMDKQGYPNVFKELSAQEHLLNETMFDTSLSSKYIKQIVVWTEQDKITVMETLVKNGIDSINGIPLNRAIVVSDHLKPEMIEEPLHKKI